MLYLLFHILRRRLYSWHLGRCWRCHVLFFLFHNWRHACIREFAHVWVRKGRLGMPRRILGWHTVPGASVRVPIATADANYVRPIWRGLSRRESVS